MVRIDQRKGTAFKELSPLPGDFYKIETSKKLGLP